MRNRQWFAVLIGIIMLAGVMLSSFYVVREMDHDCTGEDCPICEQIENCTVVLHNVGDGAAAAAQLCMIIAVVLVSVVVVLVRRSFTTPVSLKIRLNN